MDKWENTASTRALLEFTSFDDKYDYVACFDENGSSSAVIQMFKSLMTNTIPDENRRYFTVTACLFTKKEYEQSNELVSKLKNKFFKKNDKPVVLHTRDIDRKLGPFNFVSTEKREEFIKSISEMITNVKCKIVSITFDLYSYVKQGYKHDPYQVAFDKILECFCKNVEPNAKIALVFESRGKNEDRNLYKHIFKILNVTGCKYTSKKIIKSHFDEAYFNHKISSNGLFTYPGIEIADLCSYPIYRKMRFGTEGKDFEVIKPKIISGKNGQKYGLLHFPKLW